MQLVVAFSALITGVLFSHFNTIINMDLVKEANKQEENVPQLIVFEPFIFASLRSIFSNACFKASFLELSSMAARSTSYAV